MLLASQSLGEKDGPDNQLPNSSSRPRLFPDRLAAASRDGNATAGAHSASRPLASPAIPVPFRWRGRAFPLLGAKRLSCASAGGERLEPAAIVGQSMAIGSLPKSPAH